MAVSDETSMKSEKEIWEGWLEKEHGECLHKIRENVKKMWAGANEKPLAYFTTHGPEHCQAVENLIHKLIPGLLFTELQEEERFYLLASAWLHDLGMIRSIANEINRDVNGAGSNNWSELSDLEIRDKHHYTTEKYINEFYDKCGLDHKIANIDHSEDKQAIAQISKYHRRREDIDVCPETLPIRFKEYKVQLLAAYLRLADALHIDSSRVPDYAYAICLAYDIPSSIKMHWIKSKLVIGVIIDPELRSITVSFRIPTLEQLKERNVEDQDWIIKKIDYIIKDVINNLRDELKSVMHILAKGGISYYFDIKQEKVSGYIERQLLNDLLSMVINYDILNNPSASSLIAMVLMSIANISGYYLKKDSPPKLLTKQSGKDIVNELSRFMKQIESNLLNRRTCHLGLRRLTNQCKMLSEEILPDNSEEFVKEIDILYQAHFKRKGLIRNSARKFLINFPASMAPNSGKVHFNILLYGYSNLVVQALCGFRDYLILQEHPRDNNLNSDEKHNIYSSEFKEEYSKRFSIFVCDGQPKTQLSLTNEIFYHDGFLYAKELIEKNFKDVILIPDIIAGNVIQEHSINLIMMGANGFNEKEFMHSAGHLSIIKLVNKSTEEGNKAPVIPPSIVLVVTSDKFSAIKDDETSDKNRNKGSDKPEEKIGGFRFWKPPHKIPTRDNIWFLNDGEIKSVKDKLLFYNIREDKIPILNVDYIISDIGNFKKSEGNPQNVENIGEEMENINNLFSKLMANQANVVKAEYRFSRTASLIITDAIELI